MKFAVLEIGGLGHFSNPGEQVVYLTVDSPQLRRIWWKPDYPIGEFGFNPHISLYRGPDRALANRLLCFQPLAALKLLCAEFELVPSVKSASAQRELGWADYDRAPNHERLMASAGMPADFFHRLREIVDGRNPCSGATSGGAL